MGSADCGPLQAVVKSQRGPRWEPRRVRDEGSQMQGLGRRSPRGQVGQSPHSTNGKTRMPQGRGSSRVIQGSPASCAKPANNPGILRWLCSHPSHDPPESM